LRFSLHERPGGVEVGEGLHVVYDLERNEARMGAARVDGPALVWALGGGDADAVLEADVELRPGADWVVRCDRIDFPPGGVAYRHTHPGAGIRRLLHGELTIAAPSGEHTYRPGGAWFEGAGYPVLATASGADETAFVRVLLLPREWAGKRTIRYVDQADDDRPKLQRATILLEQPIEL
jgi:quercetin dioxygenase-like cupin family protein